MASLSAQIPLCLALMMAACLMIGINGSIDGAQREFDYFALSLQWPGTICHKTRHCCSSNACCRGSNSPTEFTIRKCLMDCGRIIMMEPGPPVVTDLSLMSKSLCPIAFVTLWNQLMYKDALKPARQLFFIHLFMHISTLLDALEKYWPSLYCGKSSTCFSGKGLFWAHEVDIVLYFLYVSKLFSTKAKKLIIASFLNLLMAKLGCDLEVGINLKQSDGCKGRESKGMLMPSKKHGTCSSPVIRDEYSYFITTLNVYFKYNVTVPSRSYRCCLVLVRVVAYFSKVYSIIFLAIKILNEAGYVPSNSERYPLGGIVSAIENSFRATPEVICSKEAVEEIRLCFFKDFKPRNCLASKTSCPKYVSLPAYVSMGREASESEIAWISDDEAL
ncbi:ribonuclease 2 [Gossypium australe]|uniref:Ribonuclease 2 n=1 Tax=Gossypium australe TaxID=47621 RepID=A0A5B6UPB7_9ROSI|nr:ribonuclease 2 [Gossypium australe]